MELVIIEKPSVSQSIAAVIGAKQCEDGYEEGQAVLAELNTQYDEIITWSEMYDTAGFEAKKMIVNCLISRVAVYRGYKLHIDFKIDLDQFSSGLDITA